MPLGRSHKTGFTAYCGHASCSLQRIYFYSSIFQLHVHWFHIIFNYIVLDAVGKPPSGILTGRLTWVGNYAECIGADAKLFHGKYCAQRFWAPITNPVSITICQCIDTIVCQFCRLCISRLTCVLCYICTYINVKKQGKHVINTQHFYGISPV